MELVILFAGIVILISTYLKPDWFWEHRKALALRKVFGDKITSLIYYLIALMSSAIGLLSWLGIINLDQQIF